MLTFLTYFILGIFFVGFLTKIFMYIKTPAPMIIPTTPAPVTKMGVVWRLFTEVVFFNSLFKGDKLAWAGGIVFHATLLIVLIRHLRYFIDPIPEIFAQLQIFGIVAGLAMPAALGFLFLRRIFFQRVRYISSLADYLILVLLMAIAGSGLLMDFLLRPDIVAIKTSMMTLWTTVTDLPTATTLGDTLFLMHLLGVGILLIIFPFSKLMHAGGLFFSPTRNQVDNPRESRHVNPWADQQ